MPQKKKNPSQRPRRFIVVPDTPPGDARARSARRGLEPLGALTTAGGRLRGPRSRGAAGRDPERLAPPKGLKVVNRSPVDGALLVAAPRASVADIEARTPAGTKVYVEQWYRLERPARPWLKLDAGLKAPRIASGNVFAWPVTVRLDTPDRAPLADARVTVMLDEARGIGVDGITDRRGRVRLQLSRKLTRAEAVYVEPLHGGWPLALTQVEVAPAGLTVEVPAIDARARDVRTMVYGKAAAGAGKGVKVGVVDTGVGPHEALAVAGGRNTTENESPRRLRDEVGHGSHVAGVIAAAASAPGARRGEAPAVQLYAYRIFESGDDYASTFAISAAIKQAAVDGCDLINLSIGGGDAEGSILDAIELAWNLGCVCLAATGNDGKGQVDYPARYPKALAVSAIGLENSWPAGSFFDWTLGKAFGKALDKRRSFLASFSNHGAKVALTAPGVAVVSTIFGDRWGAMSGTSMATPIATGVLARRLAASPVQRMPRDAARAAAIVQLALGHAEDLGLAARLQGKGLAR